MEEVDSLSRLLESAILKAAEGLEAVAVLFSGGLDSSLIAHVARRSTKAQLYTCGLKDAHDLRAARKASSLLGLGLNEVVLEEADVLGVIPEAEGVLNTNDPAVVTIALPLFLTLGKVKEGVVLSGQGADELFGGYARYAKMESSELEKALALDLEELLCTGLLKDLNIGNYFKKELRFPFLDRDVVDRALHLPAELKVREGERKVALRLAAERLGLPTELCAALKKAAQFGSGIAPLINRAARKRGCTLKEFFEHSAG